MKKHIFNIVIIFMCIFILSSCGEIDDCSSGHSYIEDIITEATCTKKGSVKHTCSKCNYSYVEQTAALGHELVTLEAVASSCTASGLTAGLMCSRCNEVIVEQNVIASGMHSYRCIEEKLASCTEQGEKKYHCDICNYEYIEYTPALGHNEVTDIGYEATCSSPGLTNGSHCSTCNEVIKPQVEIDMTSHEWSTIVLTEPTCTVSGLAQNTCSVCGEVEIVEITPYGHTPIIDKGVASTCTTTGLSDGSHCAVCNEIIIPQEITEVAPHKYAEEIIIEPGCVLSGRSRYECVYCSHSYEAEVAPIGHNEVIDEGLLPTCTASGLTEGSHFDRCGLVIKEQEVVEPVGHNVEIDYGIIPTCVSTGLTEGSHCTICLEILTIQDVIPAFGHSYMSYVIYESTCVETGRKYHECVRCNHNYVEELEALGHIEVLDQQILPTCTETGLSAGSHCSRCSEAIVECTVIDALGHDLIIDMGYAATCTKKGLTNGEHCNRCNEVLIEQVSIPALGHTSIVDEAIAPTCTEAGLSEGSHCSVCNDVIVKQNMIPALGHERVINSKVEPTCLESGLTSGSYCSRCDLVLVAQTEIEPLGHEYRAIIESQFTCVDDGKINYECARCDASYSEVVYALGHNMVNESRIEPTCDTTGLTEGSHCNRCNYVEQARQVIPALGHEYVTEVQVQATCTSTGLMLYKCTVCDYSYTDMIELAEHTIVTDVAVLPTCTEYGKTEGSHCGICNLVLVQQENINMVDHEYVSNITLEPTCTSTGIIEYCCSVCGDEKNAQLDALGHLEEIIAGIEPTCSSVGKSDGIKCSRCNITIIEQVDLLAAHQYEKIEVVEATCLTIGNYIYECKYCDDTYTEAIDALGHNFISVAMVEPTCTHTGLTEGSKCSRCDEIDVMQTVIPALGHKVETLKAIDATCTSTGLTEGEWCSRCEIITIQQKLITELGHNIIIDPAVVPTCISTGLTEGSHCDRCSEVLHPQAILGLTAHEVISDYAVAPTCTEAGVSSGTHCSYCLQVFVEPKVIAPTGHTYKGISIQDATCTLGGRMYYYCNACYDSFEEETQALNHIVSTDYALAPTCTTNGLTEGSHCPRCELVFIEQEVVYALGHDYETSIVYDATCTEDGQSHSECSRCSDYYYEVINKLGHHEVIDYSVSPTCTTNGMTEGSHCDRCSLVLIKQNSIAKLGHNYIETITKIATCTEDGQSYSECSRCSDNYNKVITKLGHKAVTIKGYPSTCIIYGKSDGSKCDRCSIILVEQETLALNAHKYLTSELIDFSCTSGGIEQFKCSVCSNTYDKTIPAGHYYKSGICRGCDDIRASDFEQTYGYDQLAYWSNGADLQAFYKAYYNTVYEYHQKYNNTTDLLDSVNYEKYDLTLREAYLCAHMVNLDCPLFYWLSTDYIYWSSTYAGKIHSNFINGSTRKKYDGLLVDYIREHCPKVEGMTEYNKTLYFHDLICNLIDYKYNSNGNPDGSRIAHSIAGILDRTGVVCEGYAKMLQLSLNVTGVDSILVYGSNHAYNLIKMGDDKYYWFDATWDDNSNTFNLGAKYNYFCAPSTTHVITNDYTLYVSSTTFASGHNNIWGTVTSEKPQGDLQYYSLPTVSSTEYSNSNDLILRQKFTYDGDEYALLAGGKVILCESNKTGSVTIPETVTYLGMTFDVAGIGGIQTITSGTYKGNALACIPVFNSTVTSVTIPKTVEFIVDNAFNNNTLQSISVVSSNPYFDSYDGVLYTENYFTLIKYPQAKTGTTFTTLSSTVDIADGSFSNCNNLTSINFGSSVTYFGTYNKGYNYRSDANDKLKYRSAYLNELKSYYNISQS